MVKKRGQVWIETVTYTLVAFVLIGLVISFAKPKIEELQDKSTIEQTINLLKELNSVISEVQNMGEGNKRELEIKVREGELEINSSNESIIFYFEGKYLYSEPDILYEEGGLKFLSEEKGKFYSLTITKEYSELNLTYEGQEVKKNLPRSNSAYNVFITNKGGQPNQIDFEIE